MPKGSLDDTHELDEPDEGFRASATSSNWLEGTSRDLLSRAEDTRAESADVAKPAPDDATDSPLNAGTAADLDAVRNNGRDDALRDFHLDDVNRSVAQDNGSELAQSIVPDRRERAPIQERSAKSEEAYETIAAQLDTDIPDAVADRTEARSELGDSRANLVDDNAEQLASLRETLNPMLIAAEREMMQEVVDNAEYKAEFVSGAAGLAGVHATELARLAGDLLHHDMAGAAEGLMSAQEHISGLIESAKMFRDGLEFPVIPDEVRQREQAISEWWKTLNPPPDKSRP